jgi:hypothetical protein
MLSSRSIKVKCMGFNYPQPIVQQKVLDMDTGDFSATAWRECDEGEKPDAWLVAWGAHGECWFHAIVHTEAEGNELIDKCSFIG